MDAVRWALELTDRVSPAGKKVAGAFGKISDGAKKLGDKGLKTARAGLTSFAEKVSEATPKLAKWVALGSVAAGVGFAVAGAKMAAAAIGFKDGAMLAMRALMKSDQAAGDAYQRLLKMAHLFGEDPTEAINKFNNALSVGFSARDAEKLLQAFGDLKLVTPNVNADSLLGAFGAIRSKAKLELSDFQAAVSAGGLNLTLAYEAIGKKIGKNAKEVEMLIGSGRVNAQVGLVGLLDAINQRTNSKKVGERLEEYSKTASGLVGRLKNLPTQFALRMTADDSPIKNTLSRLLGQLDPDGPNGKRIMAALGTAFTKVGDLLNKWATPEGIDKLATGLTQFIEAAPRIAKAAIKVADAVLWFGNAMASTGTNTRYLFSEIRNGSVVAGAFLSTLARWLNPIVGIGVTAYTSAHLVINAVKTMGAWLSDLGSRALGWGKGVIDGLWSGIKAAWASMKDGWNKLLESLPQSVKDKLEIHSPSRVMARLGGYTVEGFAAGVSAGAPSMSDAITDALSGGTARGLASVNKVMNTSSTSTTTTAPRSAQITFGDIIVPAGTSGSDARGLQRAIRRETTRAFELAALGGD